MPISGYQVTVHQEHQRLPHSGCSNCSRDNSTHSDEYVSAGKEVETRVRLKAAGAKRTPVAAAAAATAAIERAATAEAHLCLVFVKSSLLVQR